MKRYTICMMVLAVSALVCSTWAEQDNAEQPLRLELNLVDGSRVIGIPSIEAVPLETTYAKMHVPLKQIMTMKIGEDHEMVDFDLQNGDKLKGVINLEPIKLATVYGKVSIGMEHIREINVVLPGGGADWLRNGLVLHYSFNKDEGEKVTDASGKGNDGTVKGATWTPDGKNGGAYSLDGNSSYIDVGDPKNLQTVKSISAWVKSNANGVRQTIVSKHASANNGYTSAGYYLLKEQDDKFLMAFCIDGNNKAAVSESLATYTDNNWHHVVGVLHPETGRVDLYVDGRNVADYNTINPGNVKGTDQRPCYVGRATWGYGSTSAYSWNGQIDEVRIYNRVLSEDEVKRLYDARKKE